MEAKEASSVVICEETLRSKSDRWCWVVAGASFWINFCLLGVLRSSAVIFVALVDGFHVNREDASWPSGVFGFCMCVTAVLPGYLTHHLSIRCIMMVGAFVASMSVSLCAVATRIEHVTVFYGAFQGAGIGVIIPSNHVIINQYFSKYRALAMGISYAGASAGSFCFPPLAQWMINEYGLPGTFLLLGGIMLHSLLGVSLIRTPKEMATVSEDTEKLTSNSTVKKNYLTSGNLEASKRTSTILGQKDKHMNVNDELQQQPRHSNSEHDPGNKAKSSCVMTVDILTNLDFHLISSTFAIYFSANAIFLMVVIDFVHEKSISSEQGAFLVSAFSFGDFAGRLGCGWTGDISCVDRRTVVCCYLMAMGFLLMSTPLCSSYESLLTLCIALGLLNGSVIVNYSPLLTECLGLYKLALAVGLSSNIIGLTAFLRPLVVGYFRDQNGSYDFLFVSLGASQILVIIIWFLKRSISKVKKCFSREQA